MCVRNEPHKVNEILTRDLGFILYIYILFVWYDHPIIMPYARDQRYKDRDSYIGLIEAIGYFSYWSI